jgi:SSS family solute:Na+ symporter
MYLPVSFIFFFIGTEFFAYYTARPEALPVALRNPGMADRVFPYFIVTHLPAGVTGLLIAAIFAAAMSTIATSLNSSAAIVLTDFYKRYFRRQSGERESMFVLYSVSLGWGILGMLVALALINVKSALDAWWILSSIFSGGMLGLFLLGYFLRKATRLSAALGMISGILVITWMSLSESSFWNNHPALLAYRSPFHNFLVVVLGTMVIFFVGLLVSVFIPKKPGMPSRELNRE